MKLRRMINCCWLGRSYIFLVHKLGLISFCVHFEIMELFFRVLMLHPFRYCMNGFLGMKISSTAYGTLWNDGFFFFIVVPRFNFLLLVDFAARESSSNGCWCLVRQFYFATGSNNTVSKTALNRYLENLFLCICCFVHVRIVMYFLIRKIHDNTNVYYRLFPSCWFRRLVCNYIAFFYFQSEVLP